MTFLVMAKYRSDKIKQLRRQIDKTQELIYYYKTSGKKASVLKSLEAKMTDLVQRLELLLEGSSSKDHVPTPEEIEQATLEIQKNWSPRVRKKRAVQKSRLDIFICSPNLIGNPRVRTTNGKG